MSRVVLNKYEVTLAALLLLVSIFLPTSSVEAADVPQILVLNSYNSGYDWSDDELTGIRAELAKKYRRVNLMWGIIHGQKSAELVTKILDGAAADTLPVFSLDAANLPPGSEEELGYKVYFAENGADALEMYDKHGSEISLVLLDMIMPKMGGKETFVRLREKNPAVKVLFCSGFHQEGSDQELIALGAQGLILKPYNRVELSKGVAKAIG